MVGLASPAGVAHRGAGRAVGLAHIAARPGRGRGDRRRAPEADRSRAFNLQFWAFNMGSAIAAALAGLIAEFSFLALFLIDAGMTALTALLVWRLVPETLQRGRSTARPGPGPGGLAACCGDRVFLDLRGADLRAGVAHRAGARRSAAGDGGRRAAPVGYGLVRLAGRGMIVLGQLFVPRLIGARRHARGAGRRVHAARARVQHRVPGRPAWVYMGAASCGRGQMLAAPPNASIIAELAPTALRVGTRASSILVFPAAGSSRRRSAGGACSTLGPWHWLACGVLGLAGRGGSPGRPAGARRGPREPCQRKSRPQAMVEPVSPDRQGIARHRRR